MAPKSSSFPGLWKYPTNRDIWAKSSLKWLEGRQQDDGAEGFWRIRDHLYDFSSFVKTHPGGPEWLALTKGTDITEAFIVHHLTQLPEAMIEKYKVRSAETKRIAPYTFHPDGFYQTIKAKVLKKFPASSLRGPSRQSKLVCDVLVVSFLTTSLISAYLHSFKLAVLAGFFLAMTVSSSHNFVHMRDEWRRYYLSLSMLSAKHFRIYHTLSHHLYPNSVLDLEISLLEPWCPWLPSEDKGLIGRYATWVINPIIQTIMFPGEYIRRMIAHGPDSMNDLLPWTVALAMFLINPSGLQLWPIIILSSSFFFSATSFNAGHHHPEVIHDGDAVREDRDWGLAQLDCVIDRGDLNGVEVNLKGEISSSDSWLHFVLVLCNFGHHTLHHLFPTVDHMHLRQMYPLLQETLKEFGLRYRVENASSLVSGQFQQLARNVPNPTHPGRRTSKTD